MKIIQRIQDWLEWRGISAKDVVGVTLSMGLLFAVTGVMIVALFSSCQL